MVRISELDIIKILMQDARKKYTDIARALGVSEAAVRKKIRSLEHKGVIKGYEANIDMKLLGYGIEALIGLDTEPEMYIEMIQKIKDMKGVDKAYTSTGDHMFLLHAWFEDSDSLSSFINFLENMQGVTRVCPAIILERIR